MKRLIQFLWRDFTKPGLSLLVLAVVPLFVVFANTQIKEVVDRFTSGCVFVIDKRLASNGHILVTGRLAGIPPKALPLMFEGRDALVNTVFFDEAYREGMIPEPDDLSFHPSTGQICPGSLCANTGRNPDRNFMQVVLGDMRSEFTYRFRVRLTMDPSGRKPDISNLKIYAIFDSGLANGVCRVQPVRWFNYWVWATPLQKASLFVALVVGAGLLLRWTKLKDSGK